MAGFPRYLILGIVVFCILTWQLLQGLLLHNETAPELSPSDISVGFNLAASYGTIAVMYSNGTVVLERVDGSDDYLEVMARLSLYSSRHLAPPYDSMRDRWDDRPRQILRGSRKAIGLPASRDVGTISKVIKDLQVKAESRLSIKISSAVLSVPHLVALYQDDVKDVFDYVGIKYIEVPGYYRPLVWETAATFGGYGLGLCFNFTHRDACQYEEANMPDVTILAVHYSRNALTTSLARLQSAYALWEPDDRHTENFTLGYDHRHDFANEESYWDAVCDELRLIMVRSKHYPRPSKILLVGEYAQNEKFLDILKESMMSQMDKMPEVYSNDTAFAAAKGTAEFMKRAPYYVPPTFKLDC